MKTLFLIAVAMMLSIDCGAYVSAPKDLSMRPTSPVPYKITEANYDFAFLLFSEMVKENSGKNLLVSAPSVSLAVSMAYNGAVGETKEAMAKALQIDGIDLDLLNTGNKAVLNYFDYLTKQPNSGLEVLVADSLWGNKNIEFDTSFIERNKNFYNAEVAALDFSDPGSVGKINGWVSDNTKGLINSIISRTQPDDVMYLINAIYFKGAWEIPFDKSETKPHDFTLPGGGKISVPMMSMEGKQLYSNGKDYQAIMLPYKGRRMMMYIFLPSRELGIDGFLAKLDKDNWKSWMAGFRFADGVIKMPRFTMSYDSSLNDALSALGMGIAFDPTKADFSGMCSQKAWIGDVIHKTFIDMNEEGTEAAAVSGVIMVGTWISEPAEKFEMIVDRPFFFAIKDMSTNMMLFMGVVRNPE